MTKTSFGVRTAIAVYGRALKISRQPALMARQDEVLLSFRDAVIEDSGQHGVRGVLSRTISEVWDLVRTRLSRGRRATRISETSSIVPTGGRRSSGLGTDVRHSLRALRARPVDTVLTVGLLALGLATTGAVFAVADALLLNPVPFPRADRLVEIWSVNAGSGFRVPSVPRELALRWLDRKDLFVSGGAHTSTTALVTDHGDPEMVAATRVSPGLFETLGVRPMLGRNFLNEEGPVGANHVAIISADLWSERFGKSPAVLSSTLRINATDYRIVGVMPPEFRYPYSKQRIWLPFEFRNPSQAEAANYVTVVARLQPGVTHQRATAEVEAAGPAMAKLAAKPWRMSATTKFSGEMQMDTQASRSIWLLFGATVLLMLTVCANVANLGLSQAFSRTRDAAIRHALGATRWRMIRQTLVEQMSIGALALAIALPLTMGALRVAESLLPENLTLTSLNVLDVDWRLALLMTSLALAAPVLAGLIPAIAGSKASVVGALKQESRSVAGSRAARWYRKGLVVVEVACSVVLLVSTALLIRSFVRLQAVDTGFDTRNLLSANIGFPTMHFADGVSRDLYVDQALARVRNIPGVLSATVGSGIPPESGGISFGKIYAQGGPAAGVQVDASVYDVQPGFFETLGVRMVAGRTLAAGDATTQVVVSDTFASKVFPGQTAVGQRFRWDESKTWFEIVGVTAAVRENFGATMMLPQIYSPAERHTANSPKPRESIAEFRRMGVRVSDPVAAAPLIREALKGVNGGILVDGVDRVEDQLARNLDRPRFLLTLMLVFAGAGLLLAAVGVYGVLSCLVAEQQREYGIRLVLGAPPSSIARAILLGGLTTTTMGLLVGGAVSAMLGKTLSSVLFKVEPRDALSYIAVAAVLTIAALAAAWRPARRARSVDPALLLRNE